MQAREALSAQAVRHAPDLAAGVDKPNRTNIERTALNHLAKNNEAHTAENGAIICQPHLDEIVKQEYLLRRAASCPQSLEPLDTDKLR